MFAEFSEVHQQLAELSSDSDDEELTKSKKLQEAMKKRREDDFKSQLAFLHHEDFLNQLGQEAIPKIDNTIKVEPTDEDYEQMRQMRNRFANEFDEAVPEAVIELPSSSSEDSDDIDDDFYDRKKDRDVKGRYTIPHRRGPSGSPLRDMVRRTEAEINAEVRKKKPKAPPGIPEKQWQGKRKGFTRLYQVFADGDSYIGIITFFHY